MKISTALLVILILCSCQKSTERTRTAEDATGKGNGGNTLSVSKKEVEKIFSNLKPNLKLVFEGLQALALAEKISPRSTELSDQPQIAKALLEMLEPQKTNNALKDLATEGNLVLQEEPCKDFRGVANAAAALVSDIGGKICFSRKKIQSSVIRNFDRAAEIFVMALAVHEFVHHHIATGDNAGDEKIAQEIQNYVEQQLISTLERSRAGNDEGVVSIHDANYLEQFRASALDILESVSDRGRR